MRLRLVKSLVGVLGMLSMAYAQQGLNNLWMGGWQSWADPPFGGIDLQFQTGEVEFSFESRAIGFFRTSTNITNEAGDLLFSTNGVFVANALGDTMLNGAGLNPSWYTGQYPEGLFIGQAVLVIPRPEQSNTYLLLHGTVDNWVPAFATYLYASMIDMSLEDGLGGIVNKNEVIIDDSLNVGKLAAVRHANGRDWWVFCHKANTNTFHRLLVSPTGIAVDGIQSIGVVRPPDVGQVGFSPDGTRFAYYYGDDGLEVFRFDRCTGLFSDPAFVAVDSFEPGMGVAFSPNGRFVYVTTTVDVFQYDTEASDLAASEVHIAHWDSTYSPFPPFAALFDIAQLAPDGKIYIGTGNGTDVLHVIHNPDEPGLACNLEQHGIHLERYFSNSLPNHPNYHLGPLAGSPCDTLGLSVAPLSLGEGLGVRAFPNPSNGQFNLSYPVHPEAGLLEVLDMQGRVVYQSRLAAWSQVHRVVLEGEAAGMYQCRLTWGAWRATTRIILER